MNLKMGLRDFELGGPYLGLMREADWRGGDWAALRAQMQRDGYLVLRGLHVRARVEAVRRLLRARLEREGSIAADHPLGDAVAAPGAKGAFFGSEPEVAQAPEVGDLVEAEALLAVMGAFFGAPARTYDYRWLRAMGPGEGSGAHYDIVHFCRGTPRVHTLWTALSDIAIDMAPLAVIEGSNHWHKVIATYGQADPARDRLHGGFSSDPAEVIDKHGGRWVTAEYQAGDAVLFTMYTMHASLTNVSGCYRFSCDTRYQRADEPVDPRWVGEPPEGESLPPGPLMTFEEKRCEWGI
jgi:hypothetical protein